MNSRVLPHQRSSLRRIFGLVTCLKGLAINRIKIEMSRFCISLRWDTDRPDLSRLCVYMLSLFKYCCEYLGFTNHIETLEIGVLLHSLIYFVNMLHNLCSAVCLVFSAIGTRPRTENGWILPNTETEYRAPRGSSIFLHHCYRFQTSSMSSIKPCKYSSVWLVAI